MSKEYDQLDYYALLRVARTATVDEVRAAFHRFARDHHPDNFGWDDADKRERSAALYRRGTEAYRVLLDPARRRIYDEGLAQGHYRYSEERSRERVRTARPGGGVPVRSAKGRTFFAKAKRAIDVEDWPQAKLNLQLALRQDPDNEVIKRKLDDVLERMKSR